MASDKCHEIWFYNSAWDGLLNPAGSSGAWRGSENMDAFISCWRGKLAFILSKDGE